MSEKTVQPNGEAGGKTRKCRYACAKAYQGDLRNPEGFLQNRLRSDGAFLLLFQHYYAVIALTCYQYWIIL